MAKPIIMQYPGTSPDTIKALTAVIARLGYALKGIDNLNGLITFETGMSASSWAGQSISVHVLEVGDSVQITIGGKRNAHGAQLQVYDWGEANKIGATVFEHLTTVIGPGQLISGSLKGGANRRLILGVIVAISIIVMIIIALASQD